LRADKVIAMKTVCSFFGPLDRYSVTPTPSFVHRNINDLVRHDKTLHLQVYVFLN